MTNDDILNDIIEMVRQGKIHEADDICKLLISFYKEQSQTYSNEEFHKWLKVMVANMGTTKYYYKNTI